jgi:hypothetical protein
MLKKGEYHHYRNALNHEGKMKEYRNLLKKKGVEIEAT